jgi:hypothetical protein
MYKDLEKRNRTQRIIDKRNRAKARENKERAILYRIKGSASKRGLDFNLDLEDIVLVDRCPYLNCELTYGVGHSYCPTQATVDRIDSSKGYVKGNIQIISAKANTMKSNATKEELITFAKNILESFNIN